MRSVAFFTFGCKLNQYESAVMAGLLEKAGFQTVDFREWADVYVINTCTVTSKTDARSRQAIRGAQRQNPDAVIVVAGCLSQVAPELVEALPGVDLIIGNAEKRDIVPLLAAVAERRGDELPPSRCESAVAPDAEPMIDRFFDYSRAFVKVQEGCDSQCAYCIIPRARGPNKSMRPDWVVEQVRELASAGYREVVLCGTHLGTYGRDLGQGLSFTALLTRILGETRVHRIRLSSIEPMEFDEALIEVVVHSPRVCRHLHIPLQSGCDEILNAMNRGYCRADYANLIEDLRRRCPHVCIGADVIVGFPGETESHFEQTLEFVRSIALSYLHVFSYSVRPGTPAAERFSAQERVPPEEIKRRSRVLRAESRAKRLAFNRSLVGSSLEVLVLKKTDKTTGRRLALSDNYVNVLIDADQKLVGQLLTARVTRVLGDSLWGDIV